MVVIGVFGLFGLLRLNLNVYDVYMDNILLISELLEICVVIFEMQFWMCGVLFECDFVWVCSGIDEMCVG